MERPPDLPGQVEGVVRSKSHGPLTSELRDV